MARLIDKLFRIKGNPRFPSSIQDCQIIVCDNVARYFYSDFFEKHGGRIDVLDFPNIAPPFFDTFIEYRVPSNLQGNNHVCADEVGVRMIGFQVSSSEKTKEFSDKYLKQVSHDFGPSVEWVICCAIYLNTEKGVSSFDVGSVFFADKSGVPVLDASGKSFRFWYPYHDRVTRNSEEIEWLSWWMQLVTYPSLLTLSFLHCKNVVMRKENPSLALSKKYEKNHGSPLVKYHVLDIEPMKKVLRVEGESQKTGLKQALHICRGHFKDYSKGGGLFGKYKGLYWWDSTVRGSVSEGIVDKDYAVKSPKAQA